MFIDHPQDVKELQVLTEVDRIIKARFDELRYGPGRAEPYDKWYIMVRDILQPAYEYEIKQAVKEIINAQAPEKAAETPQKQDNQRVVSVPKAVGKRKSPRLQR